MQCSKTLFIHLRKTPLETLTVYVHPQYVSKEELLVNCLSNGSWAQRNTLFTPDIFGILIFQLVKGKREEGGASVYVEIIYWKITQCPKPVQLENVVVCIFKPHKTPKPVFKEGHTRQDGDTPSENLSS